MEFNEKLQALRKQKGLSQEEHASMLYASRTAISKWESGKGYPNIDSLRQISKLFGVTIDRLLSADELLCAAEADNKEKQNKIYNTVFSLLDTSCVLFLFLPFFAVRNTDTVQAVSLFAFSGTAPYLKTVFYSVTALIVMHGILSLIFQNFHHPLWLNSKNKISLVLSSIATIGFIVSNQPYAAVFLFCFLTIKATMLIKGQ